MKIEKKEPAFEPITITIESQMELDLLSDLFALVSGELNDEQMNGLVYDINTLLCEVGANTDYTYIDGLNTEVIVK